MDPFSKVNQQYHGVIGHISQGGQSRQGEAITEDISVKKYVPFIKVSLCLMLFN
jgi:hypothetical protein